MTKLDKELHELLVWKMTQLKDGVPKWITDGISYYDEKVIAEMQAKEEVETLLKAKGLVLKEVFPA